MSSNGHDYRWDDGIHIVWTTIYSSVGRTRVVTDCPFCEATVYGYVWSIAGHGKKCDCGALLGLLQAVPPKEKQP